MILVTGGTGYVGRHVVQVFGSQGRAVRIVSRSAAPASLPAGVTWFRADLLDPAGLAAAFHDVEIVVHAAAVVPVNSADDSHASANVVLTRSIVSATVASRARRFVHLSSAGVYGDGASDVPHAEDDPPAPANGYERSKLASEGEVASGFRASDVSWTMLRPAGLYSCDRPSTAAFFRDVRHRRFWVHGAPTVLVQPTHVDDVAAAVRLTVDRGDLHREAINIGGDRVIDFPSLIAMVGQRVGHTPHQLLAPALTRKLASGVAALWSNAGTAPALLLRQARRYVNRSVSIEKARRLIDFEPLSLEVGLDRTAAELHAFGSSA